MEKKYIAMLVIIILVLLFGSGYFLGGQNIDINGCPAQWRSTSATVAKSELCSTTSCLATPAAQQHNAIVDALLCACDKVKTNSYVDATANKRIETVVSDYFGYTLTAQQLCDQPGLALIKTSYD
jgi:hypothetical protein